jgi:hypothetical protein
MKSKSFVNNRFGLNLALWAALAVMPAPGEVIVVDHRCTDVMRIPDPYINQIKAQKKLFTVMGESHGRCYIYGPQVVAADYPHLAASLSWWGTAPKAASSPCMRVWYLSGGETNFWTNETGRTATQARLQARVDAGDPITAFGFGWCWDMTNGLESPGVDPVFGCNWYGWSIGSPEGSIGWGIDADDFAVTGNSVHLYTYLNSVNGYNAGVPASKTVFTTGPVDSYAGEERGYQRYLKHVELRNYVNAHDGILFDFGDILCWNDGGVETTTAWNGHTFQNGDPTLVLSGTGYDGGQGGCHVYEAGVRRIGHSLWWLMARLAGWNGLGVRLKTKIFLEGAYSTGQMTTDLGTAGIIPLTSPYGEDPRTALAVPANVVDWVLVQLRTAAGGAPVLSRSAFLRNDGCIMRDDGVTDDIALEVAEGDYYVTIRHRNHLPVQSAGAMHLAP